MRIDWQYLLALAAVAFLLAIVACFGSCKTVAPCVPETITRDSVFVERTIERRDTTYMVAPDSAAIRMLVECDSNNNAILAMLESELGKRINASAKSTNKGGALLVDVECREDSLRVLVEQLSETIRIMSAHKEVQVVKEKYIPRFAKFCYWWFGVSAFLLIAGAAIWLCKKFYVK